MIGTPLSKEQIEKIIRLYPTTVNREVAKIVGCSMATVNNIRKKYNLKKNKSNFVKE